MNDFITGLEAYEEEARVVTHVKRNLPKIVIPQNGVFQSYLYDKEKDISYPRIYEHLWKQYRGVFEIEDCTIISIYNTLYAIEVRAYKRTSWVYRIFEK